MSIVCTMMFLSGAVQRGERGAGGVVQRVRVVRRARRPRAHHAALGRAALLARRDEAGGAELAARAVHVDGHPVVPRAPARGGARGRGQRRRRQDRAHITSAKTHLMPAP